jgi:hypothetical protein
MPAYAELLHHILRERSRVHFNCYITKSLCFENDVEAMLLQQPCWTRRPARHLKLQKRPTICPALCVTVWTQGNDAATSTRAVLALSTSAMATEGPAW